MGLKNLGSRKDVWMVPIDNLVVDKGYNPRDVTTPESRDHIADLKELIHQNGLQEPLTVAYDAADGKAHVIDGECRLIAVKELITEGRSEIKDNALMCKPAIVENEAERLMISMVTNTGMPLSRLEEGAAYIRQIRFGRTPEYIAQRKAKTLRYVNDSIALASAPEDVKSMVKEGDVTPGAAIKEVKNSGSRAGDVLAQAFESAKEKAVQAAIIPCEQTNLPIIPAKPKPIKKVVVKRAKKTTRASIHVDSPAGLYGGLIALTQALLRSVADPQEIADQEPLIGVSGVALCKIAEWLKKHTFENYLAEGGWRDA